MAASMYRHTRILVRTFPRQRVVSLRNIRASASVLSSEHPFDEKLLEILVCPLSKKPLRYDRENNELISDELGVAYSILPNGIPNLIPQDARMLKDDKTNAETQNSDDKL